MTGLTLLNIDRESTSTGSPINEIREIIDEIEGFISKLGPDVHPARVLPLKMKLRRLQDSVSQFGTDGSIPVEEKQTMIMELHPDLQMLTNRLQRFDEKFAIQIEICMNFLLNHLCSSAAANPKSTVIGVSNVMAQVLSNEITIIPVPELELSPREQGYFGEFAAVFNSMLTTAGLFAAPVLGLPDIPISALGAWADQALQQFSNINRFVRENYNPEVFYRIDQHEKAVPFDTSSDILSFYVYENEFLAALIARSDILSGLEFPGGFSEDGEPVTLQSTDDITQLLAHSIERNCQDILTHMEKIDQMFVEGVIDRNERPEDHPDLMRFRTEAKAWLVIAELAQLMVDIFSQQDLDIASFDLNLQLTVDELPPYDLENMNSYQMKFLELLDNLYTIILEMFPEANTDLNRFIKSSQFTKFRDYFRYIIHIVAGQDILIPSSWTWTPWLLDQFKAFLYGTGSQFNPLNAIETGILSTILGINHDLPALIEQGNTILKDVRPHLEFQSHHLLAIEIISKLTTVYKSKPEDVAKIIQDLVQEFLTQHQVNPNSMLFQRANLYLAMLEMYKESGVYLRNTNERFVAFDPFSWILPQIDIDVEFPYMPLNTSLDNLNSN